MTRKKEILRSNVREQDLIKMDNEKNYFIIAYNSATGGTPVVDENGDILFFSTIERARDLAEQHFLCIALGYEIFCLGEGY